MFVVESYAAFRRFVFVEGHSRRGAARVFGLSRETVLKMCRFSLPPGEACGQAEAWAVVTCDRCNPCGGPDGTSKATAFGQAHP